LRKAITLAALVFLITASVLSVGNVTAQASEKIPVIVTFSSKPDTRLILASKGDIKHEYTIISTVACSLPPNAIDALKRNPKIEYIELDTQVHLIQGERLPWGVDQIDAEIAHSNNKGTAVKVAIIDTGIDYNHPDLDANYQGGYDFVNIDEYPMDDNGHGTHCAGIVAAEDNEEGIIGVAPEVWLYAVKALDATGKGYVSDVIAGIQWAITNQMQIISMSLGSDTDVDALHDACDAAYIAGVLVVAAAGNDYLRHGRAEFDTVDYPARYDSVIAVGATDNMDTKASGSSSGSALELAAPGVNIYSTYWDDTYATGSGTSMACPHVTGTAALVFTSLIDVVYDTDGDGVWDAAEVRQRLQDTADDLGSLGWDEWYGYGLVDANEAAAAPSIDITPPTISEFTPTNEAIVNIAILTITATAIDTSGIDAGSIAMMLDGASVTPTYDDATGLVSYGPARLAEGLHSVALDVSDTAGNPANKSWLFTVDTTPPTQVTGVTVTTVSSSQLDLSWIKSTEPDLNRYNVYRSTVFSGPYVLVASPTINSYADRELTASTIYYYKVTAVDTAENEGLASDEALGTTSEAPALPTMHVANISLSIDSRTAAQNIFRWAIATVAIVDADSAPVRDVKVYGHWESATTDRDSGTTDASGYVTLNSASIKNSPPGTTFTFVVDDIVLIKWTYDSSVNVESSDSTTS
jgi:hypothetical protein